jgi:GNAT superfamily N-acetyltransferase
VAVRRARPEDAVAIAEVHVRTWLAAYGDVLDAERLAAVTVAERVPLWNRLLAAPEQVIFVVEDEGRVAAFASVGPSRDPDADGELYAIYALPVTWGSGAASELMAAALAALRELRYRTAILWVLEENPRARRFYEREGWVCDGTRKEETCLGSEVAEVRYAIML